MRSDKNMISRMISRISLIVFFASMPQVLLESETCDITSETRFPSSYCLPSCIKAVNSARISPANFAQKPHIIMDAFTTIFSTVSPSSEENDLLAEIVNSENGNGTATTNCVVA
ncbi:hypothetical protein C8J56DRAFT_268844 [Mycena floridula]|nr:hypothetical protein C8J56DRAFT_268844 [Mycena floridula]